MSTAADSVAARPVGAESPPANFRRDIQGLRGVAVLLVVAFHAGLPLSGGFVGVDVFFVVSGFVITQVLSRELESGGSVTMSDFYARRVRRLLPALATMSIVTLLVSVLVLSPDGTQQAASKTAAAASFSVANLQLYRSSYFSPFLELNPFLHTWSLSVEEQFYLLLPAVVAVTWRIAGRRRSPRRAVAAVIAGLSLASFAACVALTAGWPVVANPRQFAFFGPVTRIWEFGAGVLLALAAGRVRVAPRLALVLGIIGAGGLGLASVAFDSATTFPGAAAALPVLATVVLITAGDRSRSVAGALGSRPLVWAGDLSYSWYLWHWPLIALARYQWGDGWVLVLAAFASLVPAVASYRVVERPLRLRLGIRGRRAVALAAVCALVPATLAIGIRRIADETSWGLDGIGQQSLAKRRGCLMGDGPDWDLPRCTVHFPGSGGDVMLIGDSHAAALSDAAAQVAEGLGADLIMRTLVSCPVFDVRASPGCMRWSAETREIVRDLRPDTIIVAHNTAAHVGDGQADPRAEWRSGMESALDEFASLGSRVVVVQTVPTYPLPPSVSLVRPGGRGLYLTLGEVQRQRQPMVSVERDVMAGRPGVARVDPVEHLCDDECSNVRDGESLYDDDDHLSIRGSMVLTDAIRDAVTG